MTDTPRCGAKTRAGGTCANPPVNGTTRCRMHGGASPQAKAKGAERLAQQAATRELTRLGITRREVHPAEALIELVHYQASVVDFWRHKVSELDQDDLTWGRTKVKTGGDDAGTTEEAKPNIAYALLGEASDRLAAYASAALKAGVEERKVRLAESQGALVAQAIRQVLDQLHLTPEQQHLVPTVVPAALRLIAGEVAS